MCLWMDWFCQEKDWSGNWSLAFCFYKTQVENQTAAAGTDPADHVEVRHFKVCQHSVTLFRGLVRNFNLSVLEDYKICYWTCEQENAAATLWVSRALMAGCHMPTPEGPSQDDAVYPFLVPTFFRIRSAFPLIPVSMYSWPRTCYC